MSRVLTIRADADQKMGTGHLMRCLALGQAWKDAGGEVTFVTGCKNRRLLERLAQEGFKVHVLTAAYPGREDWQRTLQFMPDSTGHWLVLDGYHFDEHYQQSVKMSGYQLLLIDDLAGLQRCHADIVLNQNLHAEQSAYRVCGSEVSLLLGPRFCLLRREFFKWRGWIRTVSETANKVLITMGGSDPGNITALVLQALQRQEIKSTEAVVALGADNPFETELRAVAKAAGIQVQLVVDAKEMDQLMAWADIAVSAAGATTWELAFMGLPSLLLKLAENQRPVAERMHAAGAALDLWWPDEIVPELLAGRIASLLADYEQRRRLARCSQELVDGEGADRLLMHLEKKRLRLRPVREDDARLLWEWANEPEVRAVSFSPQPVLWTLHFQWLRNRLEEATCYFYLAINADDQPVGQVRFDVSGDEANVSVSLGRQFRGAGYGTELLQLACAKVFREPSVKLLRAYVKPDNQASLNAFAKAGFGRTGTENIRGQAAICLSKRRG